MKKKVVRYIRRHKKYQEYANKELSKGKKPIKFKDFNLDDIYYGHSKMSVESQLKSAGVDWSKNAPSKRMKRK